VREPGPTQAWTLSGDIAEAIESVDNLRDSVERNPEAARAAALRVLALLPPPSAPGSAGARGGLAPRQKEKVERFVRKHLARPLTVIELAEQVPFSASHFSRVFKESFGASPHVYLTRLRLEFARRLMLTTDDSLSRIAQECGLGDHAHLSKLFRRELGETPSSWRRRNHSEAQRKPHIDTGPPDRAQNRLSVAERPSFHAVSTGDSAHPGV
jgi:AraC family transcriptional regulator